MLIHNKDDIEFVTEFPCFLGHPVSLIYLDQLKYIVSVVNIECICRFVILYTNLLKTNFFSF